MTWWPTLPAWSLSLTARDYKILARLDPRVVPAALRMLELGRGVLTLTSGRRTFEEQAALYAQGRTAPGAIVTYAKPGTSYHETGLAFDVARETLQGPAWPADGAWWSVVGELGESLGLTWGGRFPHPDAPHFELR